MPPRVPVGISLGLEQGFSANKANSAGSHWERTRKAKGNTYTSGRLCRRLVGLPNHPPRLNEPCTPVMRHRGSNCQRRTFGIRGTIHANQLVCSRLDAVVRISAFRGFSWFTKLVRTRKRSGTVWRYFAELPRLPVRLHSACDRSRRIGAIRQ